MGNYETAQEYYQKSINLLEEADRIIPAELFQNNNQVIEKRRAISTGVIYCNIGNNLMNQGKYLEAIDYLKQSIDINYKPNYEERDALMASTYLMTSYYLSKQLEEFEASVKKYLALVLKMKLNQHVKPVLLHLIDHYSKKGNFEQVKNYFQIYYEIATSENKISTFNISSLFNENLT